MRVLRAAASPIIPGAVVGNPDVAIALGWRFVRNAMYMALFIMIPLYLRDGVGLGASQTSLLLFSRPAALGLMSPLTGELLQRPPFKGRERELLLAGALVSVIDKVLGVAVVWHGTYDTFLLEAMLVIQGAATVGLACPRVHRTGTRATRCCWIFGM